MNGLDLNDNGSPTSGSRHRAPSTTTGGDNMNYDPDLPTPPQDNNQVAAWYDTDL